MISKVRQQNVRSILFDNLANLVQTLQEDVIDFASRDGNVLDERLGRQDQVMQTLLGL